MEIAAHANIFNTTPIAWVDTDLFRDVLAMGDFTPFELRRLLGTDHSKV